jgi:hypothetical protein
MMEGHNMHILISIPEASTHLIVNWNKWSFFPGDITWQKSWSSFSLEPWFLCARIPCQGWPRRELARKCSPKWITVVLRAVLPGKGLGILWCSKLCVSVCWLLWQVNWNTCFITLASKGDFRGIGVPQVVCLCVCWLFWQVNGNTCVIILASKGDTYILSFVSCKLLLQFFIRKDIGEDDLVFLNHWKWPSHYVLCLFVNSHYLAIVQLPL